MKKIEITKKQFEDYQRMYTSLKIIAKDYQTSDQLRKNCEKNYGLDFEDAIEMAYHNIQSLASFAIKGVTIPKP